MIKGFKKEYIIGIDIGGTKMSAVLFNGKQVLADYTLATPKDDLNKFIVMLGALIEPLRDKAKKDKVKIGGLGIGIPGVINLNEGKIVACRNVPILNGLKIVDLIKEKVDPDLEVKIDNDAECFTRAEALLGAGKKYKSVLGIIVGTGIGSGWWVNNNIFVGSHGTTGEIGKMIIDFATGQGLEDAYHKLTQNNPEMLAEEAYKGDVLAEKVFDEFGKILGVAFSNVVNLIDPEIIVVGGGATKSADLFLSKAKKEVKIHVLNPEAKDIRIVKSKLGEKAGAIGAALLV